MRIRNPRNALSSSTIHCLSLLKLLIPHYLVGIPITLTIFSIRSAEKKSWNTSTGDAGMGTVGPTGDVKGFPPR